jgi:hypothetical protein
MSIDEPTEIPLHERKRLIKLAEKEKEIELKVASRLQEAADGAI